MRCFTAMCIILMTCAVTTHTQRKPRKPFGPRMCEELCRRTSGCSSYIFGAQDLACHIGDMDNATLFSDDIALSRHQVKEKRKGSCANGLVSILTRKRKMECVQYSLKKTEPDLQEDPKTRLFIAKLYGHGTVPFYQLFLGNSSLQLYPFNSTESVKAVAFIHTSRRLLVAVERRLISFPLDSSEVTVIAHKRDIRSIAMDVKERIIFFIMGPNSLQSMDQNGQNLRYVHLFVGANQISIVLDIINNRIFAGFRRGVFSMTYDGEKVQTILKGSRIFTLSFDQSRSLLYYNMGNCVYSFSLSVNKNSKIIKISFDPRSLVYFNGNIYVSSGGKESEIGVITNMEYHMLGKTHHSWYSGTAMCLVA